MQQAGQRDVVHERAAAGRQLHAVHAPLGPPDGRQASRLVLRSGAAGRAAHRLDRLHVARAAAQAARPGRRAPRPRSGRAPRRAAPWRTAPWPACSSRTGRRPCPRTPAGPGAARRACPGPPPSARCGPGRAAPASGRRRPAGRRAAPCRRRTRRSRSRASRPRSPRGAAGRGASCAPRPRRGGGWPLTRQLDAAGREVGQRGRRRAGASGGRAPRRRAGQLVRARLAMRAAQRAARQHARDRPPVGGGGVGVVAERGARGHLLRRRARGRASSRARALDLAPRPRSTRAGAAGEPGDGDARARARARPRTRPLTATATSAGAEGSTATRSRAAPSGAPGMKSDVTRPPPARSSAGLLQEAQGRALERPVRAVDDEDRVQGEQRRHHLGVGRAVDRLAAERGQAAHHPRRRLRAAGRGQQPRGGRVGDAGVDHVLQRDHGAEDAGRRPPSRCRSRPRRGQVEHVGDLARRRRGAACPRPAGRRPARPGRAPPRARLGRW